MLQNVPNVTKSVRKFRDVMYEIVQNELTENPE